MEEEDRRQVVAEALRPVLEEGEQYSVYCHEGEVYVRDADTSVCASRYPRLYGRLLAVDAQVERAGSSLEFRLPALLGLAFCASLELPWWNAWLGPGGVDHLKNWWAYLLVFVALYFTGSLAAGMLQRRAYLRVRDDLFTLMGQEDIDRDTLLSLIEGDYALARVAHQLKLDADVPPPSDLPRLTGERGRER
jgi:hypothetical protein